MKFLQCATQLPQKMTMGLQLKQSLWWIIIFFLALSRGKNLGEWADELKAELAAFKPPATRQEPRPPTEEEQSNLDRENAHKVLDSIQEVLSDYSSMANQISRDQAILFQHMKEAFLEANEVTALIEDKSEPAKPLKPVKAGKA